MKTGKIGIVVTIAAMVAGTSMAANRTWNTTTGNWTNTANWSTAYPVATDNARLNAGAVVTVDSAGVGISQLNVGYESGPAVVNMETGGALTSALFRVAATAGITGTVNINGGDLIIAGGNHGIGYLGTGIVNLNSGSFQSTDDIMVGRDTGADGTLNVIGGTLSTVGNLTVGGRSGQTGTGLLDISGGATTVGANLRVGNGGVATLLLSAGTVGAARVQVGTNSDGTLTVSGTGDLTAGELVIGGDVFAGIVNLNGGSVSADKINIRSGGTLNLLSAATLDTYTNINFGGDGLLVWEGDHSTNVVTLAGDGTFTWANATAAYDDVRAFDQEFDTANGWLRSSFDGTNTEVWTVIPEPATLGLVGILGAGMLFVRRTFRV